MSKKTTAYAKKRARQDDWQRQRHKSVNPVVEAVLRQNIEGDIDRLRTGAQLHAFIGEDAPALANLAGRLIYIMCHAARLHGIEDTPDARILVDTANALGDLALDSQSIDRQRGAIVSGLAAIDRLMPLVATLSLAAGALELDALLQSGAGLGTDDVQRALGARL